MAALLAFASLAASGEARDSSGLPRKPIDLLHLIDVQKDSVAGPWTFDGATLVSPAVQFGRIAVPYVMPAEYDLRIVAERTPGGDSLAVGLVAEGRQFMAILDGGEREPRSGLDLIDKRPFYDNETTYRGGLAFGESRPSTVFISVRRRRVSVLVDRRYVINWEADYSRISLYASWFMHRQDTLFLGAWTSPQRIHRLDLFPVGAPGKPLR
jgi:hypothetical protein